MIKYYCDKCGEDCGKPRYTMPDSYILCDDCQMREDKANKIFEYLTARYQKKINKLINKKYIKGQKEELKEEIEQLISDRNNMTGTSDLLKSRREKGQ